jgi:hypothetical protein
MPAAPSETPASHAEHGTAVESADAGTQGEHTMPDGTKMPGHHHHEGAPEE